jgi:hypothetical protein
MVVLGLQPMPKEIALRQGIGARLFVDLPSDQIPFAIKVVSHLIVN